jgi:hypothetical protein
MNYKERFEDDGFVYELSVKSSEEKNESLYTQSQGEGYFSCWQVKHKRNHIIREVTVTNDACEVIVYTSVEAAVRGAKDFLSI